MVLGRLKPFYMRLATDAAINFSLHAETSISLIDIFLGIKFSTLKMVEGAKCSVMSMTSGSVWSAERTFQYCANQ